MLKRPADATPYTQDSRSRRAVTGLPDGTYVYVQDEYGTIYVVPDGSHLHPKVLGGWRPAMYAGDLSIENGSVQEVTNLSGSFQFDDQEGLLAVASQLESQGLPVVPGAVRFFPCDGSTRPVTLN